MTKKYVSAMDCGKYLTKLIIAEITDNGVSEAIQVEVPTKYTELGNNEFETPTGNSYILDCEGRRFLVGEEGRITDYQTNKTKEIHRLSGYAALAKGVSALSKGSIIEEDIEVSIVLACPVLTMKDTKDKEDYKEFIVGKDVEFNVYNADIKEKYTKYKFKFVNSLIKSESTGIIAFNNFLDYSKESLAVIDFGGLNMTFIEFMNGAMKKDSRFSERHAGFKLINYVKSEINSHTKNDEETSYIESALRSGKLNSSDKNIENNSKEWIKVAKKKFLDDAIEILEKRSISLERYDSVIFIGGTSIYLEEQIKNLGLNNIISVNDNLQWISIKGLFIMSLMLANITEEEMKKIKINGVELFK